MYIFALFTFLGLGVMWSMSMVGLQGTFLLVNYGLKEFFFCFLVDETSVMSLFMLFCCGSLALLYCYHYFSGSEDGVLLFGLMVWFLGVMGMLIFTSSMIFSLVLWEYLGLVSFFLIMFYSKSSSLRASLMTVFASRFGDVSLFMLMMWLSSWMEYSTWMFLVLFLMVVLSKSAAYPFISWLLEAMRAPTPVSSLVHSSTLVAAGVWFVYRYNYLCSVSVLYGLFFFGMVSVMITGLCAMVFTDLKKIVALSTCNKVAWCLVFFVYGDLMLALLQLLTHGVAKCFLFMSVGDLMSSTGGSQSAVGVYFSRYTGLFGVMSQFVLMFSLCGLPFLGVFFGKHGLFGSFLFDYNIVSLLLLLCGFLMSYVYSVRFSLLLFTGVGGLNCGYSSSFILIALVSFFGSLVKFCGCVMFMEYSELDFMSGFGFSLLQLFGCLLGSLIFIYKTSWGTGKWESLLWGKESLVGCMYNLYLSLSEVCVFSFYRWEVYLFGLCGGYSAGVKFYSSSVFSLNFMVMGFFFVSVFYFLVL